ncbi:MAG: hypothetical protein QOG53_3561 [Frankiales bacterium]|jgi:hypothetical protein|nr:hypothetical protein [Frankiales bacterium]
MTSWKQASRGGIGVARGAVCVGVAAAVFVGSSTAYACTTGANAEARHGFGVAALLTPAEAAALKADIAADVAALKAAKAAKLAALKAHNAAAAAAAAQRVAAAKAALRARIAAAMAVAKARAAAARNARMKAAAQARAEKQSDADAGRHHCDGHSGDVSADRDSGDRWQHR